MTEQSLWWYKLSSIMSKMASIMSSKYLTWNVTFLRWRSKKCCVNVSILQPYWLSWLPWQRSATYCFPAVAKLRLAACCGNRRLPWSGSPTSGCSIVTELQLPGFPDSLWQHLESHRLETTALKYFSWQDGRSFSVCPGEWLHFEDTG